MSKIIDFYNEECGNNDGRYWSEILGWSDDWLEDEHTYIQWLFPSNEPSQMVWDAPVMTLEDSQIFQANPALQDKLKQSFLRILKFYELELVRDDEVVEIKPVVKMPAWLQYFNHNMLRATRIIKSLRLTGLDKYARAFYDCLVLFKQNEHWMRAVEGPLW